jgi:hypothetical protein
VGMEASDALIAAVVTAAEQRDRTAWGDIPNNQTMIKNNAFLASKGMDGKYVNGKVLNATKGLRAKAVV